MAVFTFVDAVAVSMMDHLNTNDCLRIANSKPMLFFVICDKQINAVIVNDWVGDVYREHTKIIRANRDCLYDTICDGVKNRKELDVKLIKAMYEHPIKIVKIRNMEIMKDSQILPIWLNGMMKF
jgi:hypothetical protein